MESFPKILHEDDVAIGETQVVVLCDLVRTSKHVIQALYAAFVTLDVSLMPKAEFGTDVRGTLVITEQDDLDTGWRSFQLLSALRCMTPSCPRNGLAVLKKVIIRQRTSSS